MGAAACNDHVNTCQVLLNFSADPALKNDMGYTMEYYARFNKYQDVLVAMLADYTGTHSLPHYRYRTSQLYGRHSSTNYSSIYRIE